MRRAASGWCRPSPGNTPRQPGARHAFGRDRRLVRKREYSQVFRAPVRFSDRHFTILVAPNGQPHARLGLAIARRVARRAVDRNRIKRLARETFRQAGGLAGFDAVVMARPGTAAATSQALRRSLDRHWAAIGKRFGNSKTADG